MNQFSTLLNLACGQPLTDNEGRARRLQLTLAALFSALGFAALWGVAAGSYRPALALANTYKVPVIIFLSAVCAAPAGLLTWKLSGARGRGTDLLVSFAVSVFAGTLVLGVLSPLIALYYYSSSWGGPLIAQASTFIALTVATVTFVRNVARSARARGLAARSFALPLGTFVVMSVATMLQLIALLSPILPERTAFDRGIDRVTLRPDQR